MKYFILEDEIILNNVIDYLVKKDNLPQIQRRLNLYASDGSGIEIQILNNKVKYRQNSSGKFIYVKNKNLKYFFKYAFNKCKEFIINDIELFEFKNANLMFNTFHGNILSVSNDELFNNLEKKFSLKFYENINDHQYLFCNKAEPIFDQLGNLNKRIKEYATKTALDIRSSSSSIRLRLCNLSNDYTYIEKYFKMLAKNELLDTETNLQHLNSFKNISIIIPSYNSNIIPTLLSIQGQNILKDDKKKIQVVVVDDGSSESVLDVVNTIKEKLDYEINIITFSKNMGLANARNVGIAVAKYDLLLFIDSDVILSKNYLYDVNVRLQIIPNAIFVAMRKNVDVNSELILEENLLKGIDNSFDLDDSRIITKGKNYHVGWDKGYKDDVVSILDDTNFFKQLGFGARVGIYDLATVVTGHNIAINRQMINKYPAFSTEFKGWGMEDSYFASTIISNGCFVIPVLSSCVYHVNHPPRSGSLEQKTKEAKENFEKYNKMIDESWEE